MHSTRNKLASQGGRKNPQTTNLRNLRSFLLMAQLDAEGISARIREARLEAGLTQKELADLLTVHKKTVENYEHGQINYRELNQIAEVLNKPIKWILHGDGQDTIPVGALTEVLAELRSLRELVERVDEAISGLEPDPPDTKAHSSKPRARA
jgi:transcriptional regulator with XRE-family HTH domain